MRSRVLVSGFFECIMVLRHGAAVTSQEQRRERYTDNECIIHTYIDDSSNKVEGKNSLEKKDTRHETHGSNHTTSTVNTRVKPREESTVQGRAQPRMIEIHVNTLYTHATQSQLSSNTTITNEATTDERDMTSLSVRIQQQLQLLYKNKSKNIARFEC